jgi:uncharacterized protein (TIGR03067 family)
MRHLSLVMLAVAFLAADEPAAEAKKELARLQGEWVMAALEVEGQAVPDEKIRDTTLTIKGDKYTVLTRGKKHEVSITLDPSRKPKAIDMAFPDGPNLPKIGKGIYKLEGDTLVICRAQSTDAPRPDQFGTWPNTGLYLVTWKRKAP